MLIAWLTVGFALCVLAPIAGAQDAKLLERGTYLMNSIAACGNCHAQRDPQGRPIPELGLSGGQVFDVPIFKAYAANITPDPETGIGKWTEAQLVRAIREGVRPAGTMIGPLMPIPFYHGISDEDARSLAVYLKAQKPIKNAVPKSVYKIKIPAAYGPPIKQPVPTPSRKDAVKYGEYLAGPLGHCMDCHTPWNEKTGTDLSRLGAGGSQFTGPWGVSVARNLTPTGLKDWADAEIARAIREGKSRDGSPLKPPLGLDWDKNIDDADMAALIAYLRSLKPQPFGGAPATK